MLSVAVQKDIGEYTEKVVGNLSLRTSACLAGGVATAVAVAAFVHFVLGIEVANASFFIMCACVPFWLVGFFKPYGLTFEKFLPMFLDFHLEDQRLLYVPACARKLEVCQIVPAKMTKRARRAAKKKGAELRVTQISK